MLNNNKFLELFLPALAVIAGVMLKNGGKQYAASEDKKENKTIKMIGMILFIGGWIGVAYSAGTTRGKAKKGSKLLLPIVSIMAIVAAVIVMMQAKEKYTGGGGKMPGWVMIFAGLFAVGWIVLGYSVAMGKGNTALVLGLGASGLVLGSMLGVLPWQRKNKVVDGPGMAMFALAWVALACANAM